MLFKSIYFVMLQLPWALFSGFSVTVANQSLWYGSTTNMYIAMQIVLFLYILNFQLEDDKLVQYSVCLKISKYFHITLSFANRMNGS